MSLVFIASPAEAVGTLYDMDIFLNEPHPFAAAPYPAPETYLAPPPEDGGEVEMEVVEDSGDNDPIEPVNRFFFGFNEILQDVLLRPIAGIYNDYLPDAVRDGIGNFLGNLNTPVVLANDLLQFEFGRAWETSERFVVNSTVGIGGLFDAAENWLEVPGHEEDFGQTLGAWGVGEGFYVVLPVLGPSNPRDGVGKFFVDNYFDLVGIWLDNTDQEELRWARTGVSGVDMYAGLVDELDKIKETSIDYYAAIRSMYRQKRQSEISNQEDAGVPAVLELDYDFEE
ncbi:MAG: VacJ family lipoprotein [Rhodospirillales bacterium]